MEEEPPVKEEKKLTEEEEIQEYLRLQEINESKYQNKWDLLASNGGLVTVPKPDPYQPSREYVPPTMFASIQTQESGKASKTLDGSRYKQSAKSMEKRQQVNNLRPKRIDVEHSNIADNNSFLYGPNGKPYGIDRYAKMLRNQIDTMASKRGKSTRRLHKKPSENHYLL